MYFTFFVCLFFRLQFIVRNSTSGKACERLKVETRQCFARTCAVADCQLEWSSWSACSKECGGGERIRSLVVTRLPGVGGKVCPNPLPTQTEMCNTQFCGCTVGPWGNWSICNRQCGLGAQRRARQVVGSEEACSLIIKYNIFSPALSCAFQFVYSFSLSIIFLHFILTLHGSQGRKPNLLLGSLRRHQIL